MTDGEPKPNTAGVFDAPVARHVLVTAKHALTRLRNDPDGKYWQVDWVASLALLRTACNVFSKVDAKDKGVDPRMHAELRGFFQRMKATKSEQELYWSLVRGDTNAILHGWQFSAHLETVIHAGTAVYKTDVSGRLVRSPEDEAKGWKERRFVMKSGPFEGEDQRDLVERAIKWIEDQIEDMATRARAQDI